MAFISECRGSARGPYCARALALGLGIFLGIFLGAARAVAADIEVTIDHAKLVKLPERATTLVIGNPLIADASVQSGGLMVITGKGYGVTNIIALDRSGAVLVEHSVEVHGPGKDVVVVYRGTVRQTYSCMPSCEPRITLGDGKAPFDETLAQTTARNAQALGIPAGSK